MKKLIIILILILSIIFGFLFWRFGPNLLQKAQTPSGAVSLTYWGLWEEEDLVKPLIQEFEKSNPNIKIKYVRQSSINYRTRVQAQIQEGVGPDIFRIHNSWLPMFTSDLAPSPKEVFSLNEYQSLFYPVAAESFIKDNQIYSVPIEVDGLALFINSDILQGIGAEVPKTWQQFSDIATKVTVKDSNGQIKTAGAALGSVSNVDHWSDILGLLLLQQPGVNLSQPASLSSAEVFKFYTSFITDPRKKSWDLNLPSSTQSFAQGRLAFYFAPSWRAHELRAINPNLKFQIAPVPQLPGRQVAWATFWGEAVSAKSKYKDKAWEFIKFLSSKEAQKKAFGEASQVRLFGEPYSRVDLAADLANDPLVGAFVNQGPYYKFWYLASNTFDQGINDEMIKYFEDGINATLAGSDPQVALQTVEKGVKQILEKYTKPASSPK